MSEKKDTYFVLVGRVAFDNGTRDVNGKTVRDVSVKSSPKGTLVGCTIWPDIDASGIEKGDFVMAEGKYSVSEKGYHNLSVSDIVYFKPLPKSERAVVGGSAPAADVNDDDSPF
jgi:hypothetical protein